MAKYNFTTRWHVEAPIDEVWEAIFRCERWPEWWRGVESVVELDPGDASRVGSLWRYTWKSALRYRLVFDMRVTTVEPPVHLDGIAEGELSGQGEWRLFRSDSGTLVRYEWNVVMQGPWMNLLAPVARPLFVWNHDVVMRQGGQGLAQLVGRSRRRAGSTFRTQV